MNFSGTLRLVTLSLAFAGPLWGASSQLERVSTPPALQPLPLRSSGRVETVPQSGAAESLGAGLHRSQWPGAAYTAAFRGTEVFFRVGSNHAIFHIVVDGQPPLLLKAPEPGLYRVSGLVDSRHTIEVLVATESQDAPNDFGGFGISASDNAQPLPAPPSPARQIEFIGDSHTVGYGDTSPTSHCSNDEVWASTDNTEALGALTAAHFNAAYEVNAISGRGIVRNYNGNPAPTLPAAYPYTLLDGKQPWHDPAWHPQVIVIALGTNDFSTALNPGEPWKTREDLHRDYEARYVQFLRRLHAEHPKAYLILWATDVAEGEVASEVGKVAQQAQAAGIKRLTFVPVDHLQFSGCNGHPSLADHRTISQHLEAAIDAQPGIWQGK